MKTFNDAVTLIAARIAAGEGRAVATAADTKRATLIASTLSSEGMLRVAMETNFLEITMHGEISRQPR